MSHLEQVELLAHDGFTAARLHWQLAERERMQRGFERALPLQVGLGEEASINRGDILHRIDLRALKGLEATSFLAVWGRAWSQRSVAAGLLAGLVMFLGMTLSLAMLPIAFLAALWTLSDCAFGEAIEPFGTRAKELVQCVVAALATFAVFVGLTWWLYSLDLPSVWMQNFQNHAGFYAKYPRTFLSWLLVNPIELALAAGTPVFLFAASSWLTSTKGCLRSGRSLASFRLWCFESVFTVF